jgi:hypothetical protein
MPRQTGREFQPNYHAKQTVAGRLLTVNAWHTPVHTQMQRMVKELARGKPMAIASQRAFGPPEEFNYTWRLFLNGRHLGEIGYLPNRPATPFVVKTIPGRPQAATLQGAIDLQVNRFLAMLPAALATNNATPASPTGSDEPNQGN